LVLSFPLVKQTITFSISFNLLYAKTIREIVESTTIYNAFADGKGLLLGRPLITDVNTIYLKNMILRVLLFGKKS